jgi:DNA-binding transcriptional LysR family regulator
MATVPRRLAELERDNRAVKFVLPPKEMKGFRYLMIWHPRVHTDVAHTWLRSIVAAAGTQLTASVRPNRASVPQ